MEVENRTRPDSEFIHKHSPGCIRTMPRGKLLLHGLSQVVMTTALSSVLAAILWAYSSRIAIPTSERGTFNALIVGMSICLGLAVASAMKSNARELRWWLLSLGESQLLEVWIHVLHN